MAFFGSCGQVLLGVTYQNVMALGLPYPAVSTAGAKLAFERLPGEWRPANVVWQSREVPAKSAVETTDQIYTGQDAPAHPWRPPLCDACGRGRTGWGEGVERTQRAHQG